MNTRTLKTQDRLNELDHALKQINWDIIGLSEVRRSNEQIQEYDDYILYYKNEIPGLYGVGFLVKKYLKENILEFIGISDRISVLNVKLPHHKNKLNISIVQVYAPTENAEEQTKDLFYESLRQTMETIHNTVIIIGDFNSQIGKRESNENNCLGPYTYGKRNKNGHRLMDFVQEFNLNVMNSYFNKKPNKKWTWISPLGNIRNEIDYIITNKPKFFINIEIINRLDFNTDHRMVRGTITASLKNQPRKHLKSRPQEKMIFPNTILNTIKVILHEKFQQTPTIQGKYNILEKELKNMEFHAQKPKNEKDKIGTEARGLIIERHNLRQQKPTNRKAISNLSKRINESIRKHRHKIREERIIFHVESTGSMKSVWKEIQDYTNWIPGMTKQKDQKYKTKRPEILEIATEFYQDLYDDEILPTLDKYLDNKDEGGDIPPIMENEIVKAIESQKTKKAPGEDGISNDYKAA